ncbi:MAG TPA: pyridoxamine 5'-phosphate oxidase family protein [Dermatophilaceae bacterium]|nr:pyridoxamine 5'-phosphate oxidase family protein [Dermatophilaceae bacterium]
MDDADPNKRRLTRGEAVALLSRPLVGVFSTLSVRGWIHSVPVHFLYTDDRVRFLAGARDVKTRNAERTGQGTLCVETTDGHIRSYVSVSGAVRVLRPPEAGDLRALDRRYARDDFAPGWDEESFASAVTIVVAIKRWIAWADWD